MTLSRQVNETAARAPAIISGRVKVFWEIAARVKYFSVVLATHLSAASLYYQF
jgi:hypothetical protein